MTTPLGVPNLPIGALTVETLGSILQDMSGNAMRQRAGERFPQIFDTSTGGSVWENLTPFGILTALWAEFNSLVANADPSDVQGPEDLPELLVNFIEELPIVGLLVKFVEALGLDPESADTFLVPIFDFLNWLWTLVGEEADTILKPIFEFLNWLFSLLGEEIETVLQPIFEFLIWLWQGDGDFGGFGDVVESVLKPIFEVLAAIFEALGRTVIEAITSLFEMIAGFIDIPVLQGLIEQVIDFVSAFLNPQQFVDLLKRVFEYFSAFFPSDGAPLSLQDFISRLPFVSTLVSTITGLDDQSGALDLGALGSYFRKLDDRLGAGVDKLTSAAEKLLAGIIPVGMINTKETNLLSQGDFLTSSTVDAAGGWSWDGSKTRTGTGGSLKVTCTGSAQRIYCRQDIRVAEGDRLKLNGNVGTTGFTSGSMQLSVQPWGVESGTMTAKTVVNGSARTAGANTWQALPELSYTVPAGVSSVQVSLVVNCNSGCSVNFDDIVLKKTGALAQSLVSNLVDAINGILAGAGYVANQGWQFLEEAIGFVTSDATDALNNTETINDTLFENPAGGETVVVGALPTGELLPSSGNAASMIRTNTANVSLTSGSTEKLPANFYNSATSGTGITASASNGRFTVTQAGWYMVVMGFRINPTFSNGFNFAPVLYKNSSVYRFGGDATGDAFRGAAFAQSTFIVYLNENDYVEAGTRYECTVASGLLDADSSGTQTYFEIALLNKTF